MRRSLAFAAAWALAAFPGAAEEPLDFKVVVAADNPTASMPREEVAKVFARKIARWEDGTPIVPVDQAAGTPIREAFSLAVLGKTTEAMASYWQRMAFSGLLDPPQEAGSDAEVLAILERDPGAVGYVSAGTPLGPSLRVLDIPDLEGYAAVPAGEERPGGARGEDVTVGRHGDLRLLLTGSCGPGEEGRQAVLENRNPYDRLTARIETSVWDGGWFRASSVSRHVLEPLAEERLGCTRRSDGSESRYAIVEASSAASHGVELAPRGPARSVVAIVASGSCGSGRRGERMSVINRHPSLQVQVAVETREVAGDTVRRRYRKSYRLAPGARQDLGCSADGDLVRQLTVLEAEYR